MAVVNGARGLGWWTVGSSPFSVTRPPDTPCGRSTPHSTRSLPPSTRRRLRSRSENAGVDVFATSFHGALTVFAVNTRPTETVEETFDLPGLDGRGVHVWGGNRTIPPSGDSFTDTLPPLAWRIYVVAPI